MDSAVIAAIISGGVAIISPIVTYGATRLYDHRFLGKIEGRRKALIGIWRGNIIQELEEKKVTMNAELNFTSSGKVIEGIGEFIYPVTNQAIKVKFTGGFHHGQFIKVDYVSPDPTVMQFGCVIAKLSADGRTLDGRYVGYGSITDRIIFGNVLLQKTV